MKKVIAVLSVLMVLLSASCVVACNKNPENENPGSHLEIEIAQTPHCKMSVVDDESYRSIDGTYQRGLDFDYAFDKGYTVERLKAEIEDENGEVSVEEYEFPSSKILWAYLPDKWNKVIYTPIVTDNVDQACDVRMRSKFGGKGTVDWVFDYVPKGQEDNWIIIEPDENSYVQSYKMYYLYGTIEYNPDYNRRSIMQVTMSSKQEAVYPADKIYTEVTFIAKHNASVLQFACIGDFKRCPGGSSYIATVTRIAEKGKKYEYSFYHFDNYNTTVRCGYEFVGWADEDGNIVCEKLYGEFDAENDTTYNMIFRDKYA